MSVHVTTGSQPPRFTAQVDTCLHAVRPSPRKPDGHAEHDTGWSGVDEHVVSGSQPPLGRAGNVHWLTNVHVWPLP